MIFDQNDYNALYELFNEDYAGYKPDVKELPNGDGKVDEGKRYLHVALKYNPPDWAIDYLARAHFEACRMIEELYDVPAEFYPRVENGTLRVLDYPAGVGTEAHTDFDLLTVNCYESAPDLEYQLADGSWELSNGHLSDSYCHIGEIGALVGLGLANPHRVLPSDKPRQSIVYFAMPSNDAVITNNPYLPKDEYVTVGDWLKERYARSRTYK